jgi:hypothetical protein
LGISKNSVLQYKDAVQEEPQKIKRRRSKNSTTDLGPNIKQEIRFVLYDMVHQSKREERVLYSMRFFFLIYEFILHVDFWGHYFRKLSV